MRRNSPAPGCSREEESNDEDVNEELVDSCCFIAIIQLQYLLRAVSLISLIVCVCVCAGIM